MIATAVSNLAVPGRKVTVIKHSGVDEKDIAAALASDPQVREWINSPPFLPKAPISTLTPEQQEARICELTGIPPKTEGYRFASQIITE